MYQKPHVDSATPKPDKSTLQSISEEVPRSLIVSLRLPQKQEVVSNSIPPAHFTEDGISQKLLPIQTHNLAKLIANKVGEIRADIDALQKAFTQYEGEYLTLLIAEIHIGKGGERTIMRDFHMNVGQSEEIVAACRAQSDGLKLAFPHVYGRIRSLERQAMEGTLSAEVVLEPYGHSALWIAP